MPLSHTEKMLVPSLRLNDTTIRPPGFVNLIELLIKFTKIWMIRSLSLRRCTSLEPSTINLIYFWLHSFPNSSKTTSKTSFVANSVKFR